MSSPGTIRNWSAQALRGNSKECYGAGYRSVVPPRLHGRRLPDPVLKHGARTTASLRDAQHAPVLCVEVDARPVLTQRWHIGPDCLLPLRVNRFRGSGRLKGKFRRELSTTFRAPLGSGAGQVIRTVGAIRMVAWYGLVHDPFTAKEQVQPQCEFGQRYADRNDYEMRDGQPTHLTDRGRPIRKEKDNLPNGGKDCKEAFDCEVQTHQLHQKPE
jgi:hypothetical protein